MARTSGYDINPMVHERVRLAILTFLASSDPRDVPFTTLRYELELTAGNLSVQLRNLETAGYVEVRKGYLGRKPFTSISLTIDGLEALQAYVTQMESIIETIKGREE